MADYKAVRYTEDKIKSFQPVYDDFRSRAVTDYNFELEPLSYDDFVDSVRKGLINCIILLDSDIPVGFLIYTTMISEAIELNIIHSLNNEDYLVRSKCLIKEFLEETAYMRRKKIVCYPMLGEQKKLVGAIARYGFKFICMYNMKIISAHI